MSFGNQIRISTVPLRSLPAELLNSVTHGFGLLLSIVGAVALLSYMAWRGDVWHNTGCWVFATTLVAVYLASTCSHAIQQPEWKRFFRVLDQGLIYLLIAGSYTPWCLTYHREGWGWLLLCAIWTVALGGFFSKVWFNYGIDGGSVWLYVLLGWLPITAIHVVVDVIPLAGFGWLLLGGLCYSVGIVFLVMDRKDFHFHAIWHMCVIAGSTCQYFAVLNYLVPGAV